MSDRMVLPKIIYKGCDDPKKHIEMLHDVCSKDGHESFIYDDVKASLYRQENQEERRLEQSFWLAPTWEEHKRVMLKNAKQHDICVEKVPQFLKMSFPDMMKSMSGVVKSGYVSADDISCLERKMDVILADSYKEFLCMYGQVDIYRVHMCGIYEKDGLIDGITEIRQLIPHFPRKYYPICSFQSDKVSVILFLQDDKGYVYAWQDDGIFEPWYMSLQEFVVDIWALSMEEYL